MPKMLEQKSIIVTGAARGLGRAIAELVVEEGGRVVIADVLDQDTEALQRELSKQGAEVVYRRCDVTDANDVQATIQEAVAIFGAVDGIVNNAGVGVTGPTLELTEAQFDLTTAVNLKGVFLFLQHGIRQLLQQNSGGSIVNMGSAGSLVGTPEFLLYTMSKHGVLGMTKSAALEFASSGIRINAVCPGPIWTEMLEQVASQQYGTDDPAEVARKQNVPSGRLGTPRDVAELVVWLLSDRSANCTGSSFTTDGGYTAQ